MPYPVSVAVVPALSQRNRLTTAFRLILYLPHLILVGGVGIGVVSNRGATLSAGGEGGLLGAVVAFFAILSWITILIYGWHLDGARQFTAFYLRWRVRALAYFMLLEDPYPPFGDDTYPTTLQIDDPVGPRNRLTVALRLLMALPHVVALIFVVWAWSMTTIVAWFAILLTASYPRGLYEFGVGALRWVIRVQAYVLLMVDDYPPFSLT